MLIILHASSGGPPRCCDPAWQGSDVSGHCPCTSSHPTNSCRHSSAWLHTVSFSTRRERQPRHTPQDNTQERWWQWWQDQCCRLTLARLLLLPLPHQCTCLYSHCTKNFVVLVSTCSLLRIPWHSVTGPVVVLKASRRGIHFSCVEIHFHLGNVPTIPGTSGKGASLPQD